MAFASFGWKLASKGMVCILSMSICSCGGKGVDPVTTVRLPRSISAPQRLPLQCQVNSHQVQKYACTCQGCIANDVTTGKRASDQPCDQPHQDATQTAVQVHLCAQSCPAALAFAVQVSSKWVQKCTCTCQLCLANGVVIDS